MRRVLLWSCCLALCASALAACEGAGGHVTVLSAGSPAVAPGATYAWAPPLAVDRPRDPRVDNDIIRNRIRGAIDANLAAKGYRRIDDPKQANLLVTYHLGIQSKTEYQVDSFGGSPAGVTCGFRGCVSGYGWGLYGPPSTSVRPINYNEGQLLLDLTDASSGQLAWQAVSRRRVVGEDATEATLSAIVADMVKDLPGGPAKAG
jgi:hypothetical protein